jgi:hypothetical protein
LRFVGANWTNYYSTAFIGIFGTRLFQNGVDKFSGDFEGHVPIVHMSIEEMDIEEKDIEEMDIEEMAIENFT